MPYIDYNTAKIYAKDQAIWIKRPEDQVPLCTGLPEGTDGFIIAAFVRNLNRAYEAGVEYVKKLIGADRPLFSERAADAFLKASVVQAETVLDPKDDAPDLVDSGFFERAVLRKPELPSIEYTGLRGANLAIASLPWDRKEICREVRELIQHVVPNAAVFPSIAHNGVSTITIQPNKMEPYSIDIPVDNKSAPEIADIFLEYRNGVKY